LLRYALGASVPAHAHEGYEHILVLQGVQQDERGHYGVGSFLAACCSMRPVPCHAVESPLGCVVLAIWERPVRFFVKAAAPVWGAVSGSCHESAWQRLGSVSPYIFFKIKSNS
jgi:anti-sigma factor ChrR (cupin superfamily)